MNKDDVLELIEKMKEDPQRFGILELFGLVSSLVKAAPPGFDWSQFEGLE